MCCSADHIGPPPGWYEPDIDDVDLPAPPRVSAHTLEVWAGLLGSSPRPRPVSSSGGGGRALPHRRLGDQDIRERA